MTSSVELSYQVSVRLLAKRRKRSAEKTKEAKDQRRLSIEMKKRAHVLSSTVPENVKGSTRVCENTCCPQELASVLYCHSCGRKSLMRVLDATQDQCRYNNTSVRAGIAYNDVKISEMEMSEPATAAGI